MADNGSPNDGLPGHVESTVEAIAQIRADSRRRTSRFQKTINALTARFGSPEFLATITLCIFCWIAANVALLVAHRKAFDAPPFFVLQGIITTTALYVTVLILTTQRHENMLAEHRAQLTLQIALVSERKLAKLIERGELHRRDDPHVENADDPVASEMSSPVDAGAVVSAIRAAQEEADRK